METERRVLEVGRQVRLNQVDRYGFCGRDLHPAPSDVGFVGFVTAVLERARVGEDGSVTFLEPTHGEAMGEDEYAVYEVKAPGGRALHLVDYEVEVLR